MSFSKVEDWLRSLGLICYAQAFYDNGYEDIDICQKIGDADLDVIGVKSQKDRNDILASLIRLQNGALYFELEPEEIAPPRERERLEPLMLKTRIKEELDKRDIKLTEPPYFNLDGSFGDLTAIAEMISFDLNTITEDVLDALTQMRRRQLPAEAYAQLQDDDSEESNPQEYLNVETGLRGRRATSLSKYDGRITKSTSNLHETDLQDAKGPSISHFKGQPKKAGGNKKAHGFGKLFQSMRRTKSPMLVEPPKKSSSSDITASDIHLSQDELKNLMRKVKNKELSQDDALNEVNRKMVTRVKSKSFNGEALGSVFDSSPESSPKEKKESQEKKKKEKAKKKKTTKTKKSGHNSTFYYGDVDHAPVANDSEVLLTRIGRSPLLSSSSVNQANLTTESSHEDSPELANQNRDKSGFKKILKRSFRRNGKSPINGDESEAFRSNETLNSSTGSTHSSSQDSIVSGELHEGGSHNNSAEQPFAHIRAKQLKKPPPIPVREDIQKSKPKNTEFAVGPENQHRIVRQMSKSVPVPPPRNIPAEKEERLDFNRKQNERSRSVTFNESSSTTTNLPNTQGLDVKRQSATLSHSKPSQVAGYTMQGQAKIAPVPPPRSTTRRASKETCQAESPTSPPVAPPRLKRSQSKVTSAQTSTDGEIKAVGANAVQDSARIMSLPVANNSRIENFQDRGRNEPSSDTGNNKNQNSFTSKHRHETVSKSVSLDNNKPHTVLGENLKPPILGEKPSLKPKPAIPPRPVSTFGAISGSNFASERKPVPPLWGNGLSTEPNFVPHTKPSPPMEKPPHVSTSSESDTVPPIRARPLKDLVKKKLRKESIDISQRPYTTQEGKWNVPPALLHRYSEELEKPVCDVVVAMEGIRQDVLMDKGQISVPYDVTTLANGRSQPITATTVDDWLIETGLPMFSEDFKDVGITSFERLLSFPEDEFKDIGVYDKRHITRLLEEIQSLRIG